MATRLLGSLLGRLGSGEVASATADQPQANGATQRRSSSGKVQAVGSMKGGRSGSMGSDNSTSLSSAASGTARSTSSGCNSSPDQQQQHAPSGEQAAVHNGFQHATSPFSAAVGPPKVSPAITSEAEAPAGGEDTQADSGPAHKDSASSAGHPGSDSAGQLSPQGSSSNNNSSKPPPPAPQEPSAPPGATAAAAVNPFAAASHGAADAERALSLSQGFSDPLSAANLAASAALAAINTPAQAPSDMSFLPSTHSTQPPAGSAAQLQQPSSTPGSTPRLSSPSGLGGGGLGLFSMPLAGGPEPSAGLEAGFLGMQGLGSGGGQGGGGSCMEAMVAELQATAGLTAEQAAAAAAVMMSRMAPPAPASLAPPNPFHAPTTTALNPWATSPPGQAGFGLPQPLSPNGPLSPTALRLNPLSLNPGGQSPDLGAAAFLSAQAELLGSPAAALGTVSAFGGPLVGFDSVHSSSSNNVASGAAYGLMGGGPAGGMLSPEDSYLADVAQYAHDGLDVPGTAQVAVHNVPFKWCNEDLEDLFRQQEGYLDAQLLFHENGRSKGVGVGLFRDRACAVEACNKLSGAQADGRKLELVLMNPDNHVSFSCTQVAVLGLPWEYTHADVRALLEAAAEAEGTQPSEAGVQHVEVAYREDGKSEGRAIATFGSRRQAHDAIRRLHGKETLAGLRMRLFYLHEQQQTRNQNVLAQLRTQPQLLPSLMPGLAGLAIRDPSLSPRHPNSLSPTPLAAKSSRQSLFATNSGPAGSGDGGEGGSAQPGGAAAEGNGAGKEGEGAGGAASGADGGAAGALGAEGPRAGEDVASGSGRSSLEKDSGPVILHVSGLMENVTREQLRELFSQAGEVTKVDIPDGGRSMGYGFITFSNPQAAEQAMLLFNNYPLGGGAIHVAYSTSATAKARQQALRQARKATLGNSRVSTDGGPGRQPGTPRGMAGGRRPGPTGVSGFPSNPSLGALGSSLGGMDSFSAARHSFDAAGYGSAMGGMWPRGPAGAGAGLSGPGGLAGGMGGLMSHSLGALGGPQPGLGPQGAAMGQGRARRSSFEYGMGGLQMLQGAGASPGFPAGLDVSTAGNLDQQLQLLMQMTGTAGQPGPFGASSMLGLPGAPPGTPPAGGFRPGGPMGGAAGTGGLFSPPISAAPVGLGGLGGPGSLAGFSTPHMQYMAGAGLGAGTMQGGSFAARPMNAATAGAVGQGGSNLFSPPSGMGPGAAGAAGGRVGLESLSQPNQRQVLVTGLPPGLTDADLRALFEICGPLKAVSKQHDQDFAIISYDSVEHAQKAISVLDGVKLPSGSTLSLQFTTLIPALGPDTPAKTSDGPWNPALSPAGTPGIYGPPGAHSAFATGLATPPRGSFAGEAAGGGPGSAVHSGSLFGIAEAGSTGELYGGAFGMNLGGLGSSSSHLGGFGSVGAGLRMGASSPAIGRPPRDGVGPAAAAASALYTAAPLRTSSPAPMAGAAGARAGPGGVQGASLPPMYSGVGTVGMTGSGSAGNLFARGGDGEGVAGPGSRGRAGSNCSDGGSVSDVGVM